MIRKSKSPHDRIEKELEKILVAEIGYRIRTDGKRADSVFDPDSSPQAVAQRIESINREIVLAHNRGDTARHLGRFFAASLQMMPGGRLFIREAEASPASYRIYLSVKSRCQALLASALHSMEHDRSMEDDRLRRLFDRKRRDFTASAALLEEIAEKTAGAEDIWRRFPKSRVVSPRDEDEAVSYLKEGMECRLRLDAIESGYLEWKGRDARIDPALRKLRRAIHKAKKSLSKQDRNASRHLMAGAGALFKLYRKTPPEIERIDTFLEYSEILVRYRDLFDSLGDRHRKERVEGFIKAVGKTLNRLQTAPRQEKAAPDISDVRRAAIFYRRAFFALLPVTLLLALFSAYCIFRAEGLP